MRLKSFKIENYKSLKIVDLDKLSDITVFVGRNDSGKSNVLKALDFFFNWQHSQDFLENAKTDSITQILGHPDAFIFNLPLRLRDHRLFYDEKEPIVLQATMELETNDQLLPGIMYFQGSQAGFMTSDVHSLMISQSIKADKNGNFSVSVDEIFGSNLDVLRWSIPPEKKTLMEDANGRFGFVPFNSASSEFVSDKSVAYRILKHIRGSSC